jgi:FAD/FMN-containing dehydrogenase
VISGEHGIGITKLEFLTDDELAVRRLQGAGRPRGPLQQGQAAAGG